jgi:hypothetical protein
LGFGHWNLTAFACSRAGLDCSLLTVPLVEAHKMHSFVEGRGALDPAPSDNVHSRSQT